MFAPATQSAGTPYSSDSRSRPRGSRERSRAVAPPCARTTTSRVTRCAASPGAGRHAPRVDSLARRERHVRVPEQLWAWTACSPPPHRDGRPLPPHRPRRSAVAPPPQRLAPTRISRPGCASSPALVRRQRPPGPERRPRAGSRGERLRRHRARLPGRRHRGDLRLQVAGLYRELFYTACRRQKRDAAVLPRGPRYRPRGGRIHGPGPSRRTPLTASWPRPSKTAPSAPPTTVPIATGPPRSRLPAYTTSPIDSDRSRAPRLERELAEAERTVTAAARIAASPPSGARTSKPKCRTAGDPAPIYSASSPTPRAIERDVQLGVSAGRTRHRIAWPRPGRPLARRAPSFAYLPTFSHLDWEITMATGFAHSSCAKLLVRWTCHVA